MSFLLHSPQARHQQCPFLSLHFDESNQDAKRGALKRGGRVGTSHIFKLMQNLMIFGNFGACAEFESTRCPPFCPPFLILRNLENISSQKNFAPKLKSIPFLEAKIELLQSESEVAKISDFSTLRESDFASPFVNFS